MEKNAVRREDMRLLAAVACFVLLAVFFAAGMACASPLSVQEPKSAAHEAEYAEALRVLQTGDYPAAYRLYMDLLRSLPGDAEIDYGLALAAQGAGYYSHALLALERLADARPGDASLRIQMARVNVHLGDPVAAQRELDAATKLDPVLTAKDGADIVRALQTPPAPSLWQWSARLGSGVTYDTNANQGPQSPYMTLGVWPLYVEGAEARSSWGKYIAAGLNVLRRLGSESSWALVGDAALYKRWNSAHSLTSNREFGWGRTGVGLRYLTRSFLFDARLKGEFTDEGREQYTSAWGAELLAIWAVHPRAQLVSRASWERRLHRLSKFYDGDYWWLGQYLRLFLGDAPHEVMIGARLLRGTPIWHSGRNGRWAVSARLTVRVSKRLSLSPFVEGGKMWYEGPATFPETDPRADAFVRWGVGASFDLTKNLKAEISWMNGRNWSRSALYRYTQQTSTVGLSWSF